MELNGVEIEDTFAEAFPIKMARVLITAATMRWATVAAQEATGFGTSVIGCPAEAGIEMYVDGSETPDGRPGVYIQIYTFGYKSLEGQLLERIGQCILTAPTTAVFNGLPDAEKQFDTGNKLRYFADGTESQKEVGDRKMHVIPMMEGDFLVEDSIGGVEAIAGGNFFIFADTQMNALTAAENAVDSIQAVEGVVTPFPGGIVASGSKAGANKYKFLKATANEKFCPSIKDKVEGSEIPADVNCVYEIVINGVDADVINEAMAAGIEAAVAVPGVKKITAGNYGGNLGPHKFNLHDLL
ncbi:formylmethanofuran-tetrahydromethanopterin formyltransferase [Methanococcoides vulcani]|uniref:Formylmethanofuran--tetrahydromethanopterin formyltransferase n=1 Tax=Methanococcoides vulcani TaxID=1353158 RepID=A0A1I0ATS5_9EURY|nr:formylmethanofuran--tetrahydromethanopterin N-formyltransferase [Methanococcoides vulcani]SES97805.1 formylmethanofuran-tetrahydromethanopterin formyltransferase [Methanococcoides vulcani]